MKNRVALMILMGAATIACTQDKPKNVAPADYAETEQKLIQNREQDSLKAAADQTSTTTANGYKMPADSADSSTK